MGILGIFFFFFQSCRLTPTRRGRPFERGGSATCLHCGRQLWSAAGGPVGTAEPATCSGEFVWKRAGRARAPLGRRTEPSTADRHTRPLSHSRSLARCRLPPPFLHTANALPLPLRRHSLPSSSSSRQGSEITA